ncbi:TonB-dependent receptor domain-containing protein [Acuticoccus sp. I52.16.1]|uniref:TonB-dependent receptor domain-containing protein n=1 Tax=Acuticoccus sp. I52.16.1 TaxID=2928472 RepID=UPI001FD24813|nr:TonB-dependent receptor [Acuticoccus sp. I52.16.1]UOM33495.1 TonB-dependent receptor [Acuticoccus sp. I52.16.1]
MMRHSLYLLTASVSMFPIMAYAQSGSVIQLDPVTIGQTEPGDESAEGTGTTGSNDAAAGPDGDGDALAGDPGAPGSFTVGPGEIARNNPTNLQELFVDEPTVTVGSSIPMSQKIFVQGVEEPNLAVTIDGTRQNNKVFHHNATTLIDTDLLKAVRVDPGVAPADAGPGALGGAIAFETKDVDDILAEGKMYGGQVTGEYQTNGDIFATSGQLAGRYAGFEALLFGKWATGDLMQDGNGDDIIGSGTSLLSGLGKVAYEAESGDRIEAAFEIVNDDDARPYRADIGQIIGGRPVPLTRDYDLTRQNYTLTYTDETPRDFWDPKVQLGFSVTDVDLTEPEQTISGTTQSLNGRAQNTIRGEFGSIVFGSDFYVDEAELDYRYLLDRNFDESGAERAQNVGFYTQARLDITDRVRASGGARVDVQHFEGIDGTEVTNAGPSLNLSGEVDVTSFLTAYAGVSHVWAGIPLAENFIMNPNWIYDTQIEPTTSDNVVAGLRAHYQGLRAGAKVFQTKIYNARTPDYSIGPAFQRDIRTRGYELSAGYDNYGLSTNVAYAFIDSEIDGNPGDSYVGRYLTVPVGHVLTGSASYLYAPWGVRVGANIEVAFEYDDTYDVDLDAPGEPLPGYQVVNAFAEWTPVQFPNLTVRAEVNNLFDEEYAARGTYGTEFGSVVPLYEPGRSFLFKAAARF